ncbi:MAG: hypothetical protein FJY56_16795 [Betaproteobacteria bacterium]|nr:hypothetical protein [Betaproteobacteria bacterium]
MEYLLAIILVWAVIFGWVCGAWKVKEREIAKKLYLQALAQLKHAPTDAKLKQRTLSLGRAYARLTRDPSGRAAFDELALMRDINAACDSQDTAASMPAAPPETPFRH